MSARAKTLLFASMVSLLCACGGSAPAVKHTVSMDMLSQTPPEARLTVSEAYRTHYDARLELAHTRFLLSDIDYELRIARAKKAQARHSQKIAKLEKQRSAASFRSSLAEAAQALLNGQKKDEQALSHRVRYLEAQRRYLRKRLRQAKADVIHTQTRFELAKAQLADERNTIPKGFKLSRFISQEKKARSKALKKAQSAKAARSRAQEKERKWKKAAK